MNPVNKQYPTCSTKPFNEVTVKNSKTKKRNLEEKTEKQRDKYLKTRQQQQHQHHKLPKAETQQHPQYKHLKTNNYKTVDTYPLDAQEKETTHCKIPFQEKHLKRFAEIALKDMTSLF